MTHKIVMTIIEAGDDDLQKPFVRFEVPPSMLRNSGKQIDIYFEDKDTVKDLAQHLYKKATITIEVAE